MQIHPTHDRRGALRLVEKIPVGIECVDHDGNIISSQVVSTKNISENGFSLHALEVFPQVDILNFETIIPGNSHAIKGQGRIVRRNDKSKIYGIEFLIFSENNGIEFKKYINRSTYTRELLIDRRTVQEDRRNGFEPSQNNKRIIKNRRNNSGIFTYSESFPRMKKEYDYEESAILKRLQWLEVKTNTKLKYIRHFPEKSENLIQNIENLIGTTSVPLGIAGPVLVHGQYAQGLFYVPISTTQGTMLESYHRGALLINKAGGARVAIHKDELHLDPIFIFKNLNESLRFVNWIKEHDQEIKQKAQETTRHGHLLRITSFPIGNRVALNFSYSTGDAMGLNMINIATDHACRWIAEQVKPERRFLRSNFSSDKKPSFYNFMMGYGKEVTAEVILPRAIIKRYMRASPEDIYEFWYSALLSGMQAGMIGINAHFANGMAGIFIATGQDVAQVANGSIGMLTFEFTPNRDLKVTTKFPQLLVGTVGGGTSLGPQKEALELMGCYGPGKAKKFAEIVAAILLAGEISICGALASGEFADADLALRARKTSEVA